MVVKTQAEKRERGSSWPQSSLFLADTNNTPPTPHSPFLSCSCWDQLNVLPALPAVHSRLHRHVCMRHLSKCVFPRSTFLISWKFADRMKTCYFWETLVKWVLRNVHNGKTFETGFAGLQLWTRDTDNRLYGWIIAAVSDFAASTNFHTCCRLKELVSLNGLECSHWGEATASRSWTLEIHFSCMTSDSEHWVLKKKVGGAFIL